MTIVRELTTKLSFQVDKKGIQEFNRQIIGIKSKMALAVGVVGGFITAIFKATNAVSAMVLDAEELAEKTEMSVTNLLALQQAGKQFRIAPEETSRFLTNFADSVLEARNGYGELFKLTKRFKVNVRDGNGEIKKTDNLFFEIADKISKVNNKQQRLFAFSQLVGKDLAGKFDEFFSNGSDGVKELQKNFESFGQQLEGQKDTFQEYEKNLSSLQSEFSTFGRELVLAFAPALTKVLQGFNSIFKLSKEKLGGGAKGFFNAFGAVATDQLMTFLGFQTASNVKKQFLDDDNSFNLEVSHRFREVARKKKENINVTSNNTVNIEVPVGSTEEQASFISETVEKSIKESQDVMIRGLQNDNPQVE